MCDWPQLERMLRSVRGLGLWCSAGGKMSQVDGRTDGQTGQTGNIKPWLQSENFVFFIFCSVQVLFWLSSGSVQSSGPAHFQSSLFKTECMLVRSVEVFPRVCLGSGPTSRPPVNPSWVFSLSEAHIYDLCDVTWTQHYPLTHSHSPPSLLWSSW